MELRKEVQKTGTSFIKWIHGILSFLLIFKSDLAHKLLWELKKKFQHNLVCSIFFEKDLFLFFYEKALYKKHFE